MKQFDSFSEIDDQLKILSLQRAISIERCKLNLNKFKADLYPTYLLGGLKGLFQQTLISFIAKKITQKRKAKQVGQ
jgi:hypothetical protein